jgi:hypothetical protein
VNANKLQDGVVRAYRRGAHHCSHSLKPVSVTELEHIVAHYDVLDCGNNWFSSHVTAM